MELIESQIKIFTQFLVGSIYGRCTRDFPTFKWLLTISSRLENLFESENRASDGTFEGDSLIEDILPFA